MFKRQQACRLYVKGSLLKLREPSVARWSRFWWQLALAALLSSSAGAQSLEDAGSSPEASGGYDAGASELVAPSQASTELLDAGPSADASLPQEPIGDAASVAADTYADAGTLAEPAAEESVSPEQASLGTIMVTAQRRTDSIQKTPISMTAFGKETIDQQKISTFRDLAGRVPGLLVPLRSTSYTTQIYSMRGIGEIDTYPEPSVAVYVDDVYLARSVGSIYDTPDLERVEVLRGPQGTLYGRNSSAGAIRFITKTPTAEQQAGVSVRLGTYNDQEVRARVNGGIVGNDKLNGSLSLIRHTRKGYTYDVPLDKYVNNIDIWSFRSKVKSQVNERFSIVLSGDGMFDRSTASYYTPINQPNGLQTGDKTNPDRTWSLVQPLNKTTVYGGSTTLQYDVNDEIVLKSVTSLRGMHGPIYYDNDGVTAIKGDSYAGFDQLNESQEFSVNGEYNRVNFVGGLYYFHEYFHNHRLSQAAGAPVDNVGVISHTNSRIYTHSVAGFGQANIKLIDQLTLTLGGRYTVDIRSFANRGEQESKLPLVYPLPNNFDPKLFGTLFDGNVVPFNVHTPWKTFSRFTPKVGLQYEFLGNNLVYASFSQGFKSGGYDLRATTAEASITPFKPQVTSAYEAGLKTSFLKNRITANLAGYYNDIKDIQVRATSPGALGNPVNRLINAGDAHTYGGELEIAAAPVQGLRLGSNIAYLRTGYDSFTATLPPNVAGRTTLLGRDFPLAPRWQVNFNGNYAIPLPFPGVLRVGGDVPFESRRYVDIYNTKQLAVRRQAFVNATINYTAPSEFWTLGVTASNLTDLRRPQAGGYAPSNAGAQPLYYGAYNPPRTIIFYLNLGKI
ncbi:MAG: iron complex outerrane recepter protein [Myxococcaceae bacterium]|nr:iron complex outerrane recepter protein [Myxococcaceae bacterium]